MTNLEEESLEKEAAFNVGCSHPASFISGRDEYGLPIFKGASEHPGITPNVTNAA